MGCDIHVLAEYRNKGTSGSIPKVVEVARGAGDGEWISVCPAYPETIAGHTVTSYQYISTAGRNYDAFGWLSGVRCRKDYQVATFFSPERSEMLQFTENTKGAIKYWSVDAHGHSWCYLSDIEFLMKDPVFIQSGEEYTMHWFRHLWDEVTLRVAELCGRGEVDAHDIRLIFMYDN